jgi:hypothetical protein
MRLNQYLLQNIHRLTAATVALLIIALLLCNQPVSAQGTWTQLQNPAPDLNLGQMLLLSDGSVICKTSAGSADGLGIVWDKLTPDTLGSYINGSWSTINPMYNSRLYFASQVLKDGRVFVGGGEYGTGGYYAETYDPANDVWTPAPSTFQNFADANSEILPDGRVMIGILNYDNQPYTGTAIFDPVTNTWAQSPSTLFGHDESAWLKLPDGSVLFVDADSTSSERYIPSLNQWIPDGTVPLRLYDTVDFETGPAFLLPDGRGFFIGSTGHTAYYTPTGNNNPGSWAAGPDVPAGYGMPDASGAMMANGNILITASPVPMFAGNFNSPTAYFEFNYRTNSFAQVGGPWGTDTTEEPSYVTNMLDLPDGNVLYAEQSSATYFVYTPTGAQVASGKPAIATVVQNNCDSFTITGTLFNGISEGAAYGDDGQMATNYPLVRLTLGNRVYYARTFNWNRTGVQTGNLPDTAQFIVPGGLRNTAYALQVVANGISSNPFSFTPPSLPYLTSTLTPPAICSGTLFTYNASASTGATFSWTRAATIGLNDTAITVAQTTNPSEVFVDTTFAPRKALYNYTVTANGCSIIQQVGVTVNTLPDTGYITAYGPTTVCQGNLITLTDS